MKVPVQYPVMEFLDKKGTQGTRRIPEISLHYHLTIFPATAVMDLSSRALVVHKKKRQKKDAKLIARIGLTLHMASFW